MPDDFPSTPDTDVLDQAADWADLARGPMDAETKRAFNAWLAESPAHFAALKQIEALDSDPHLVAALRQTTRGRTVSRWPFAAIGGLAAAAAAVLVWLSPLSPAPVTYASGHGAVRQIALSDGSRITLDADSELVARFGLGRRTIDLRRGQAWFAVAHDPLKPFVVHAGAVEATAVGTAFRVDRSGEVAVTQGTVRVAAGNDHQNVGAGTRADFDGGHLVLASFDPTAPDFRTGWIDLRDAPLSDVLDRFNRYGDRPIVLADPVLSRLPVSGRFRLDQPRQSVSLIAAAYGLKVTVGANGDEYTIVSQKVRTGGL